MDNQDDIIIEKKGEASDKELEKAHAVLDAIGKHDADGAIIILERIKSGVAGSMFASNMSKVTIIQTMMTTFGLTAEEMTVIAKLNK